MYPVYEKSGIRTVQIPSSHKPGALGDDVMRNIRAIMQRANSFLDTHDVNATGTSAAVDGAAVDHDASADVEGSADVEALKRELQELRSISQASQVAREIIDSFSALCCCFNSPSSQVKSEMERALIEEEVLNDLADHPTVEYIRRLEDERT